ncbi:MAG: hypothetical protein KAS72_13785 [Phycisphaerales bacterium]|nr:hypothetical protein [Phycisphaerales bacterium]
MTDIDKTIRAALQAEDQELFDKYGGEQSLLQMIAESFRGRQRWLMIGMHCNMLILTSLAVLSAIQFFRVESTRAMIAWSSGFIVGCLGTWLIKLWWWTRTDKNAVTREIKRLELQIARLAARLREN